MRIRVSRSETFSGSATIPVFTKSVSSSSALKNSASVSSLIAEPNAKAWNTVIKSHVDSGRFDEALFVYKRMRELNVVHDNFTFPIINRAVLFGSGGVMSGEIVHCVAIKMSFGSELYFCNTMMEVYGEKGSLCCVRKLFDEMPVRDLVSWTSMISVYVYEGMASDAFDLFNKMKMVIEPNSVTVIVLLQGCCDCKCLIPGQQVHGFIFKNGLLIDGSVQNTILRMYTKAGNAEEIEKLFDDINPRDLVSWNILISFYSSRGDIEEVIDSFKDMMSDAMVGVETLTMVISAFAERGGYMEGKQLQCYAIKSGLSDDAMQTSLLDFYSHCGDFRSLARLFWEIPRRNAIHMSTMVSGLVQNGYFSKAIALFMQLKDAGIVPVIDVLRSLVDGYASLGALRPGKAVHAYLIRNLTHEKDDLHINTSILNMYIKCGSLALARKCFNKMLIKDVVTWTSMIEGYGTHGLGMEALKLFHEMVERGNKPNSVTFLSLLSACSHSGLLNEGCKVYHSMKWQYGLEPKLAHSTCLVDLLARSGKLKEALTVALKMVICHDTQIWRALLAASRVHGQNRVGEFAARRLLKIEPDNVECYILMSNVKASGEKWSEAEEIWKEMNEKEMRKEPAWSYLEAA